MNKEIQQIEFEEHIRKRTGMYLEGVGSKGIINLLKGLISDCLEVTKSNSFFFQIELKPDNEFALVINSSGNIDAFERTVEKLENLKNFHLKACKALSTNFTMNPQGKQKLTLNFKLDDSVFIEEVDYQELSENFLQWTYLNRNSEVLLIDEREKFLNQNYYHFPEGVKYLYDRIAKEALGKPEFEISFDGEIDGFNYQIYLGYRTDWFPPTTFASFANNVHTSCGGSLIDGVINGLISGCRKFVNENQLTDYKIKKKKFNNGLILVASVRGDEFKYGGSFKETLEDQKIKKNSKKLIKKLTIEFINANREKAEKFLWRFNEKELTSGMY
ncbi:DNA topoisomerase subunit B [Brumimicrobium mesophilum]|uniref:hypothetical protein n=1 Tax=Brumimicrobium mesophilum TaxID=392717 RepID=UPI000D13FC66|nr:hypothetical protein [Brumimicrobium mesophilum]